MDKQYQQLDVLSEDSIAALSTATSNSINLMDSAYLSITLRCTFDAAATGDAVAHIYASPDGTNWDTEEYTSFTVTCTPGATAQRTIPVEPDPKYVRVTVENEDAGKAITNVVVVKVTTSR